MEELTPQNREYTLIHGWRATAWLLLLLLLFVLALIGNGRYQWVPGWMIVLAGVTGLIVAMATLHRFPLTSYTASVTVDEQGVQVNDHVYPWSELVWYRLDTNSALVTNLVLRFREKGRVNLMVANATSTEQKALEQVCALVVDRAQQLQLPAFQYYDTAAWQVAGWVSLLSIPCLWLVLPWLGFELRGIAGPLTIWSGTALAFFALVRRR